MVWFCVDITQYFMYVWTNALSNVEYSWSAYRIHRMNMVLFPGERRSGALSILLNIQTTCCTDHKRAAAPQCVLVHVVWGRMASKSFYCTPSIYAVAYLDGLTSYASSHRMHSYMTMRIRRMCVVVKSSGALFRVQANALSIRMVDCNACRRFYIHAAGCWNGQIPGAISNPLFLV